MKVEKIELVGLRFSSNRSYGGEGEIKILMEDIKRNGLINPITVKLNEDQTSEDAGTYEVIAGRRRVMAVDKLGWKDILCCILEGDEIERAEEIAGSENINRLAMHPIDEAKIFKQLLENGRTIEELAKQYDRSASAIWQRVQLLDLNEDIKTLFKNGNLSLHAAAMLKSLDAKGQEAFAKKYKTSWEVKNGDEINDNQVRGFITNLGHDRLYSFVKEKQCADCKTRTYFSDKALFPELENVSETCFNHECYLQKWNNAIANRIKSIRGEHKSHAEACLIVSHNETFQKITGKKITIEGVEFKVIPFNWSFDANSKDKGAVPCFKIDISVNGKLEIEHRYYSTEKEKSSSSSSNAGSAEKRRSLTPIVNILNLPEAEKKEALDAMNDSKRISAYTFKDNIRQAVFWKAIEIKAQEFNDPKKLDTNSKEIFLKKYFANVLGADKKIFDAFVGKLKIEDIAKMPPDKIFTLLCAMEWDIYSMPTPDDLTKESKQDIVKWIGLPAAELKALYQEEIRKRIPKTKSELKKPEAKKADKPAAKKTTAKKTAEKKPAKAAPKKLGVKLVKAKKPLPKPKKAVTAVFKKAAKAKGKKK